MGLELLIVLAVIAGGIWLMWHYLLGPTLRNVFRRLFVGIGHGLRGLWRMIPQGPRTFVVGAAVVITAVLIVLHFLPTRVKQLPDRAVAAATTAGKDLRKAWHNSGTPTPTVRLVQSESPTSRSNSEPEMVLPEPTGDDSLREVVTTHVVPNQSVTPVVVNVYYAPPNQERARVEQPVIATPTPYYSQEYSRRQEVARQALEQERRRAEVIDERQAALDQLREERRTVAAIRDAYRYGRSDSMRPDYGIGYDYGYNPPLYHGRTYDYGRSESGGARIVFRIGSHR